MWRRYAIAARATGRSASMAATRTSTLLIDATMKGDMPPLALPKQPFMERARQRSGTSLVCPNCGRSRPGSAIRSATGCPNGTARRERAVAGRYLENGRISAQHRRKGVKPETKFRPDRTA